MFGQFELLYFTDCTSEIANIDVLLLQHVVECVLRHESLSPVYAALESYCKLVERGQHISLRVPLGWVRENRITPLSKGGSTSTSHAKDGHDSHEALPPLAHSWQ